MKPHVIFIHCMPRSQSAWLALALSAVGIPCMHEPVYNIESQGTDWIDKWIWIGRRSGSPLAFIGSDLIVYREEIEEAIKRHDYIAHHVCLLRSPAEVHASLAGNTPLGDCPREFTDRIHHLLQKYHYELHLTYPLCKEDVLKIMRLCGHDDFAWRHFVLEQMERMHVKLTEKHLKRICDDARNEH